MQEFNLEKHEYIELCNLLKTLGLCENGGAAKAVISDGQVKLNGEVETRKKCKLYPGSIVEYLDQQIIIKK